MSTLAVLRRPRREHARVQVVGGDRGLCGGYNANVIRAARDRSQIERALGRSVVLIAVGRKVDFLLQFRMRWRSGRHRKRGRRPSPASADARACGQRSCPSHARGGGHISGSSSSTTRFLRRGASAVAADSSSLPRGARARRRSSAQPFTGEPVYRRARRTTACSSQASCGPPASFDAKPGSPGDGRTA